jgi:hypothetical protein
MTHFMRCIANGVTQAILGLMLLAGCVQVGPSVIGSGVAKNEPRDTGDFTAVQNDISANLDIAVGQGTSVIVEGDDNILPFIKTEVRNGVLVITSNTSIQTRSALKVTITTPQLSHLAINGSGDANIRGLSGGEFDGSINGSGNINATGTVDKLAGRINGSGGLQFKDLSAQSATINITGSGNARVDAATSLSASITGSGDISYKPNSAMNLQTQVVGSGSVKPM